jgi:hypothetical protein
MTLLRRVVPALLAVIAAAVFSVWTLLVVVFAFLDAVQNTLNQSFQHFVSTSRSDLGLGYAMPPVILIRLPSGLVSSRWLAGIVIMMLNARQADCSTRAEELVMLNLSLGRVTA